MTLWDDAQAAAAAVVNDALSASEAATAAMQAKLEAAQATVAEDALELVDVQAAFDAYRATHPDRPPRTLFGAYPGYSSATDHTATAAANETRVKALFGGGLAVERLYQGGNLTLPPLTGPAIVSWDFPLADTLAGKNDAAILTIAASAKADLWFVPWHEVDNKKMAPGDFVTLFRYIATRVHTVGNPLVHMTPVFMGFTVKGGVTTTFDAFYPGDDVADAIGFDQYVNPGIPAFKTAKAALSAPLAIAKAHGKPLVIGEVSLYPGYTDDQWTQYVGDIVATLDGQAAAVAWFETNKADGDWRLANHPTAARLWGSFTSRNP